MNRLFAGTSSALAALILAPTAASYVGAFHTPARQIYCEADRVSGTVLLSCAVAGHGGVRGIEEWYMRPQGRARVHQVQANIATDTHALPYGRMWRKAGFACLSRPTGLTCLNRSGHGWILSRQRQRIF